MVFNYNNPEFISMQNKTFKKFVEDDYEFMIFSDSPTQEGHDKIERECTALGIECVRVPQHIHQHPYYLPLNMPEIYTDPIRPSNVRHAHSIQYALDTRGFDFEGTVLIVDTDAFLVRPFNISEYMKNYDILAYFKGSSDGKESNIMYCCPILTFLNMETLPNKRSLNFNCGLVNNCSADTGGFTHYYLKAHPDLRWQNIASIYSGQMFCSDRFFPNNNDSNANIALADKISFWKRCGFNEKEIKFLSKNPDTIEFFMEGTDCWFMHYRGGSNYENLPAAYHSDKKNMIKEYLDDILN